MSIQIILMAKAVIQPFDNFVKSRIRFVQKVAEYANKRDYIEKLEALGALTLLKHLLKDRVESIRQSAALTLGRMAEHKEEIADAIVAANIIPIIVSSTKGANVQICCITYRNTTSELLLSYSAV